MATAPTQAHKDRYAATARIKRERLPSLSEEDPSAALGKKIAQWLMFPDSFYAECLNRRLSNQQTELVRMVGLMYRAKFKRANKVKMSPEETELSDKIGISIHAGRGAGKGFVVAGLIPWCLMVFDQFKGIITANSQAQIEDVLSNEVRQLMKGASVDLMKYLDVNSKRILKRGKTRGTETNFFAKRTCSIRRDGSSAAEVLSGYHAPHMMIIVDEASGPPDGVFTPLTGTLSDPMNVVILIGNPTKYSGYFWKTHYDAEVSKQWMRLRWNLEESNLHEIKPGIKEYIASQLVYGRESNAYRINVLGLPPLLEKDSLIPMEWIWDAVESEDIEEDKNVALIVGVDPGRTGDETVILRRRGNYIYDDIIERLSNDTMVVADWVGDVHEIYDPDAICIDVVGLGAGVADKLSRDGIPHNQVNVAKAPSREGRFINLRAELYWHLRTLFEGRKIRIPRNEKLIYELASIKVKNWEPNVQLFSKKEMKLMGLRSPNIADALMLSYYVKHLQAGESETTRQDGYRKRDKVLYSNGTYGWMVG